jgi:hypothetical protein
MTEQELKERMAAVLNEYVKCGVIGLACDRAGMSRKTHRDWLEQYPQYKEMFEEVKERFVDGLEAVAIERAKDKSDGLLTLMLKAHRREVYGDSSDVNIKGGPASPITLVFAEGMLNPAEKEMLGGEADGGDTEVSVQDRHSEEEGC